jgi:hypothetical protein
MDDTKGVLGGAKKEVEALKAQLAALEADHAKALDDLGNQHAQDLEKLRDEHAKELAALEDALNDKIAQLDKDHADEIARLAEEHAQSLADVEEDHSDKLAREKQLRDDLLALAKQQDEHSQLPPSKLDACVGPEEAERAPAPEAPLVRARAVNAAVELEAAKAAIAEV